MNAARISLLALLGLLAFTPNQLRAQVCTDPNFRVELLAGVPDIEHPSVVTCDDDGNLFVGEDPMDMRGPTTKEFDRIIYFRFNPDGSIRSRTVFAEGLSAVFGMVWHDGALYVMHAPHYTMFKDTDGDGVADVTKQLADGFGPPAGIFGFNDHIVTGTRLGLDGYVYVSVGDKGVPLATGNDGSQVSLEGGGVVRMRLDGTDLQVFSCGTRNHLDVAMDSLDNIFTYDNTDDGLGWWTRFTYHMPTGYYGYPFDYHPHQDRHLPRISEHGGGSPVGAACYRESVWPERYRDAAFHCEWGKGKLQVFFPKREGAGFTATMEDFLIPDTGSDFRPQDVCFSPDGSTMYVADWNFGGWTQDRQVGRVYRVTYTGPVEEPQVQPRRHSSPLSALADISSRSYHIRRQAQHRLAQQGTPAVRPLTKLITSDDTPELAKVHALWAIYEIAREHHQADPSAALQAAVKDASPIVRAQAARALATLYAQVRWATFSVSESTQLPLDDAHRQNVPAWVPAALLKLATNDSDPMVRMHASVALGRIQSNPAMKPMLAAASQDAYARFATIQAARTISNWPDVLSLVEGTDAKVAQDVILAATGVANAQAVAVLERAIQAAPTTELQVQAVEAIGEVHHLRAPYESGWWGTRPAASKPQRPREIKWDGTDQVMSAIRRALTHPSPDVRIQAIAWLGEWDDPEAMEVVRSLAVADSEARVRVAVFDLLANKRDAVSSEVLGAVVADLNQPTDVRQAAVEALKRIGGTTAQNALTALIAVDQTPPELLVSALNSLAELKVAGAHATVQQLCVHDQPLVRAAAAGCLVAIRPDAARDTLERMLEDDSLDVRRAALNALAAGKIQDAVPAMLRTLEHEELRSDATLALAQLADRRALLPYLSGLVDRNPQLRGACARALTSLRADEKLVGDLKSLHQRNELAPEVRRELGQLFATPRPIQSWLALGTWSKEQELPDWSAAPKPQEGAKVQIGDQQLTWKTVQTQDAQGKFEPNAWGDVNDNAWALAYTEISTDAPVSINWLAGSDDQAKIWVDDNLIYEFDGNRGWSFDQGRGDVKLTPGDHKVWFLTGNSSGPWQFSLALGAPDPELGFLYESVPTGLDLAAFRKHGLEQKGDAARGKKLFFDQQGVGCIKCHSVGNQGTSTIGPNLLGVGAKYPRDELIRSILEPSNRIASGYEMTLIMTVDGAVLQGIIKGEEDGEIVFATTEGEIVRLDPDSIDAQEKSPLSAMPNGLEKGLTLADFADLVDYLASLTEAETKSETPKP